MSLYHWLELPVLCLRVVILLGSRTLFDLHVAHFLKNRSYEVVLIGSVVSTLLVENSFNVSVHFSSGKAVVSSISSGSKSLNDQIPHLCLRVVSHFKREQPLILLIKVEGSCYKLCNLAILLVLLLKLLLCEVHVLANFSFSLSKQDIDVFDALRSLCYHVGEHDVSNQLVVLLWGRLNLLLFIQHVLVLIYILNSLIVLSLIYDFLIYVLHLLI